MTPELMEAGARAREAAEARKSGPGSSGGRAASYGRVVEEGDHTHLLAHRDGIYRRLFERQVLALTQAESA